MVLLPFLKLGEKFQQLLGPLAADWLPVHGFRPDACKPPALF
jgi:hypothetical protein